MVWEGIPHNSTLDPLGSTALRSSRVEGKSPATALTGLLSNQGEKSINFYFIMVPLRKKY